MRVHLIKKQTILEFTEIYTNSRNSFENWLEKVKHADWEKPTDIKATFRSADFLGKNSNRVVFDIGGNNYRLICQYVFGERQVHLFVCWIGTHAEYDGVIFKNEQYWVNNY